MVRMDQGRICEYKSGGGYLKQMREEILQKKIKINQGSCGK